MAYRCGNCGAFYTQAEVSSIKPPRHPWSLTASGMKVIAELQRVGSASPACPGCGQPTLVVR
jgi:hypothetical protein